MFNNSWNPRNRNMPWTHSPVHNGVSPNGDQALVHHIDQSHRVAYFETGRRLQQEINQILNHIPPFPSSSNIFDVPVQQAPLHITSSFRDSPLVSLMQPRVFPLAPRNYSLRPRPNPPLARNKPTHGLQRARTQSRTDLTLSPPPTLPPPQALPPATSNAESSAVEEPLDSLTMPYLNQLDHPIQVVVDLVESDNEENACNVLDLTLKL